MTVNEELNYTIKGVSIKITRNNAKEIAAESLILPFGRHYSSTVYRDLTFKQKETIKVENSGIQLIPTGDMFYDHIILDNIKDAAGPAALADSYRKLFEQTRKFDSLSIASPVLEDGIEAIINSMPKDIDLLTLYANTYHEMNLVVVKMDFLREYHDR